MMTTTDPMPLWQPSEERIRNSRLHHFQGWLEQRTGEHFNDYDALWRWSVDHLEAF